MFTFDELERIKLLLDEEAARIKSDYEICVKDFGENHSITKYAKNELSYIEGACKDVKREYDRFGGDDNDT